MTERTTTPRRASVLEPIAAVAAWSAALAPRAATDGLGTTAAMVATLTAVTVGVWSLAGASRVTGSLLCATTSGRAVHAAGLTALGASGLDAIAPGDVGSSRVLAGSAGTALLVLASRRVSERRRRRHAASRLRVVLIADDRDDVADLLADDGVEVVACVGDCPELARRLDVPWRRSCDGVIRLVDGCGASVVAVTPGGLIGTEAQERFGALRRAGVTVHLLSGLKGVHARHVRTGFRGLEPCFQLAPPAWERLRRAIKRTSDVLAAALLLVSTTPVLLVAALAIKLDDGGPILFRQRRVGRDGTTFWIVKLRTMQVDAEARLEELLTRNERSGGPLFKLAEDPRVTRAGRFLRTTSIDELPQLWCVIRGDMSLVGPRPALPAEVARFDERLEARSIVRPGITGLWQVGRRDAAEFAHYRRLDIFYVDNWSLRLDLTILLRTAPAVLGRALDRRRPRTLPTSTSTGRCTARRSDAPRAGASFVRSGS